MKKISSRPAVTESLIEPKNLITVCKFHLNSTCSFNSQVCWWPNLQRAAAFLDETNRKIKMFIQL